MRTLGRTPDVERFHRPRSNLLKVRVGVHKVSAGRPTTPGGYRNAVTSRGPQVILIGPPGSGKSTVGPLLARQLGMPFHDADADLETEAGRTISDIFTDDGEPAFRALEEKVVAFGLTRHTGVYALGGGAVLSEVTRALLRGHTVVFLNVSMAVGVQRTGLSSARPLLAGVNPRATYRALLDARLPIYREVATLEVATEHRTPAEVVDAVLAGLPVVLEPVHAARQERQEGVR